MKYVIFFIGVVGVIPLINVLRHRPLEQAWAWILFGFSPFLLSAFPSLNFSAISWPIWPGFVKGFQITAVDLYALALYVALPRQRQSTPFRLSMIFYLLSVVLSIFFAQVPFAAVFYAWQVARMFLVYAVVIKSGGNDRVINWILTGMAAGIGLEAFMAIWERYVQGVIQAGGTLGHQNSLGVMSHFVVFPFFALLLAGQRGWLSTFTPLGGAIVWILTASRATIGLGGIGLALMFAISALRKWTAQKARVLLFGAMALAVLVPAAMSSLSTRFADGDIPLDDVYDERLILKNVAANILADNPMGIGANNFTVVANTREYYNQAGLSWMSANAIVHNIYWLAAAETGYVGFAALALLLLHPLFVAFRCGWQHRNDPRGDLLLGCGMALFIVYVHSYYEWALFSYGIQYVFSMELGLVGGLAMRLGYWRAAVPRHVGIKAGTQKAVPETRSAFKS